MDEDEIIEEEEKETPEQEKARMLRAKKKMEAFMADVSSDMMPPGVVAKLRKMVERDIRGDGIPFTKDALKAYRAGFMFSMTSIKKLGMDEVGPIAGALFAFVKEKEDALKTFEMATGVEKPPKRSNKKKGV